MAIGSDSKSHNEGDNQSKLIAYIDGANLHKGVEVLGWKLDYRRLRSWLRQKFGVQTAYIFIGMIKGNALLYSSLQDAGFILVFKDVTFDSFGKIKGNCDSDLVLKAARQHFEEGVNGAVLVSNDGDHASLVQFWQEKHVTCTVLSPSIRNRASLLLRRTNVPIVYLHDVRNAICWRSK